MNKNMYNVFRALLLEEEALRYQARKEAENEISSRPERNYLRFLADRISRATADLEEHWSDEYQQAMYDRAEADRASSPNPEPSCAPDESEDDYPTIVRPAKQPSNIWAATAAEQILEKVDDTTRSISQGPMAPLYRIYFFKFLDYELLKLEENYYVSSEAKRQVREYLLGVKLNYSADS